MLDSLTNLLVRPVLAQDNVPTGNALVPVIDGVTNLKTLFNLITNVVLIVGVALVVVFLILAGIQYITARGDTKQATAAKDSLTNAIIGFIIVIAAFTIRIVILNVLGAGSDANNLNNFVPTP
jgi:hypothetical protein